MSTYNLDQSLTYKPPSLDQITTLQYIYIYIYIDNNTTTYIYIYINFPRVPILSTAFRLRVSIVHLRVRISFTLFSRYKEGLRWLRCWKGVKGKWPTYCFGDLFFEVWIFRIPVGLVLKWCSFLSFWWHDKIFWQVSQKAWRNSFLIGGPCIHVCLVVWWEQAKQNCVQCYPDFFWKGHWHFSTICLRGCRKHYISP